MLGMECRDKVADFMGSDSDRGQAMWIKRC